MPPLSSAIMTLSEDTQMAQNDRAAFEKILLSEDFDAPLPSSWVSYVGGENEESPSWTVEGGVLRQPVEDGLIRAILTGDDAWSDYSVEARIHIDSKGPDGRAGLVFRDDGRGFYVLRFTRSSGRAQLMYHSRSPFGWHELATLPITSTCDNGQWVSVKIEVRGPFIRCFFDDSQYIDLTDSRSNRGRVGFYACEAKAKFDRLRVIRRPPLSLASSRTGPPLYAPSVSFWFRETFVSSSVSSWMLPHGWSLGGSFCIRASEPEAGSSAHLQGAPFSDGLVQVRLRLLDETPQEFLESTRAILSGAIPPPGPPSSESEKAPAAPPVNRGRAGLILRSQGPRYYAFVLERSKPRVQLSYRDDQTGQEQVLAVADFNVPLDDRWYTLTIQCKGESIVGLIDNIPCLAAQDRRHTVGSIGLFAEGGSAVFADLLAASGK